MTKTLSVLGSTGSIGTQALEVSRNLNIRVVGLCANRNIDLLEKQAREFMPLLVAVADEASAGELNKRLKGLPVEVMAGMDGMKAVAAIDQADTVLAAIVGIAGLIPVLAAIEKGRRLALANKETLVTAGSIVMEKARRHNSEIIPVDSEHSAIFQCLKGSRKEEVSKLILTASGGPFRGKSFEELKNVTVEQALKHPNWSMGKKITIDSATLANKGLEVIEAHWIFDMQPEKIEVVIHPQSVIHSMVEYVDGSVLAQLGTPDMKTPIQYAMTHPARYAAGFGRLDLLSYGSLTFEKPDMKAFPCLELAYEALKFGGTMPAVYNGANEAAVELFLSRKADFTDIPVFIERIMGKYNNISCPSLEDIIEADRWAKELTEGLIQ